jgi:cell division cycle protein 20 (cofactor of APC complex)
MAETLNGGELEKTRIISYKNKAPEAPESHANGLKVLFSHSKGNGPSVKKNNRYIPQGPERILDAPELRDDFYLNLIDWSCNNHLAVALGPHIYLWNACTKLIISIENGFVIYFIFLIATGDIQQLLELESPHDYVCSVKWIKEGNILAVGNSNGEVALWDVNEVKKIRQMEAHSDRVGCLSWNKYILSSGSRSGAINHSDVRTANHLVQSSVGHTLEVCGLAWSPDGSKLASGGNDNILHIWSAERGECYASSSPKFTFK